MKYLLLTVLLTGCTSEISVTEIESAYKLCRNQNGLVSIVKSDGSTLAKCTSGNPINIGALK
jgi:hypothetical protein